MGFKDLKEGDRKRLIELLDETILILQDDPLDKVERLKKIHKELCDIRKRITEEYGIIMEENE